MIAHELEPLLRGARFVVGGDLNSALLFDSKYGRHNNRSLFENLRTMGFVDLRMTEGEQRTYFKTGNGPYHLDHVFADAETASSEHTWRVLCEPATELALSDHAPIVIDFDSAA